MPRRILLAIYCVALAFASNVLAAEPPAHPAKKQQTVKHAHKKPMPMNEPMQTGMKKEGMMKGDVKKAAAEKQAHMQDMMKDEEKAMPGRGAK
jgi:hypothetical protein